MRDPRALPLPDEPFDRAIALARELAYGAMQGEWGVSFWISRQFTGDLYEMWSTDGSPQDDHRLTVYLDERWNANAPSIRLLELLGYVTLHTVKGQESSVYMLTPKALDLLQAPAVLPTVFISYARRVSSAFALLIEARLAMRDVKAFVDKQIEGGADWEDVIRDTINHQVSHMVVVLAPGTLDSAVVRREIRWALEANLQIVPIWHSGFSASDAELGHHDADIQAFVRERNALRVPEESAAGYDAVIAQLLNLMEFAVPGAPAV